MTVLAVPRSTAMSRPVRKEMRLSDKAGPPPRRGGLAVGYATRSAWRSTPFDPSRCSRARQLRRAKGPGIRAFPGRRTDSGRSALGEPELDLALGRLVAVARVDQVLGGRGREVAPERARLGVVDLGR